MRAIRGWCRSVSLAGIALDGMVMAGGGGGAAPAPRSGGGSGGGGAAAARSHENERRMGMVIDGPGPDGSRRRHDVSAVVGANGIAVMLVAGFERYCRSRFAEVESVLGVAPDWEALLAEFWKSRFAEGGFREELAARARESGRTVTQQLVEDSNFSFQDFGQCARLYRSAYGIRFDSMGLDAGTMESVRECIRHRNRIVHADAGIIPVDPGPDFDGPLDLYARRYVTHSIGAFDRFVAGLEGATGSLPSQTLSSHQAT